MSLDYKQLQFLAPRIRKLNGKLNADIKKNYELLNGRQGYPKLTTQRHPHSVLSFCLHPTSHSPSALGST